MTDTTGTTSTDDAANAAALAAALAGATDGDGENGDGENGAPATGATGETGAEGDGKAGEGETAPTAEQLADLTAQLEAIKAESRKWEQRSKDNFKELEALKRSGMSDDERKAYDAAATSKATAEALERAEKAEAALLRKTIAIDLSLSKENAAILDGISGNETALRALAATLAATQKAPEDKAPGGVLPTQGAQTGAKGSKNLGEMFADTMGDLGL